jgi:gluconate kinase
MPLVPRAVLEQRLAARFGHYMPVALLDSQLSDLESLGSDERGLLVDGTADLLKQIEQIHNNLSARRDAE